MESEKETAEAPEKQKPKKKKCHWCGKIKVPIGFQSVTGRPFCSNECWDKFRWSEGFR